ncbi:unnamed protein product [Auanema sp. JU1783]|nr:unnamed protein product [Auanema sp. JU1783]
MNVMDCLSASHQATNKAQHYLLLFKIVTAWIAAIVPIAFWRFKGLGWLGHKHTQIYFAIHMLWSIELPLTYSFVYLYDYLRISIKKDDPCDYLISTSFSMNTRILPVVGLVGEIITMFVICIERALSTIRPVHYERFRNNNAAFLVCFISVIASFGLTYGILFFNIKWDAYLTTYTLKTPENANRFQLMTIAEVIIEVSAVVIFMVSLIRNNQQHKLFMKTHAIVLANKYQIKENRKVLKNLLPLCILHGFLLTVNSFGLSIYPLIFPKFDPIDHAFYLECIGQVHLYSIIGPIILTYGVLRKKRNVVNKIQHHDEYFVNLKNHFEKGRDTTIFCE